MLSFQLHSVGTNVDNCPEPGAPLSRPALCACAPALHHQLQSSPLCHHPPAQPSKPTAIRRVDFRRQGCHGRRTSLQSASKLHNCNCSKQKLLSRGQIKYSLLPNFRNNHRDKIRLKFMEWNRRIGHHNQQWRPPERRSDSKDSSTSLPLKSQIFNSSGKDTALVGSPNRTPEPVA